MRRPGIVFLDAATLGDVDGFFDLIQLGNLTVYQSSSHEQKFDRIRGKEIIITNKVIIDKELIDSNPSLKLICIAATGMNNVDLEYAAKKGIQVKNVAGYSTESVVQHTFTLLFNLMGKTRYYDDFVKSGKYTASNMFTHHDRPFHEVAGKHFGIIGMGTIGKRVAEVATAFGAKVIYFSTSQKNTNAGYTHLNFDDLLSSSDILSVHCPLNDSTKNLITITELQKMKESAFLINTGRGGIVNEEDLARALNNRIIAGAALDVLSTEPSDPSNPLLQIKDSEKLIITPHMAWASHESRDRLMKAIIENIQQFLESIPDEE